MTTAESVTLAWLGPNDPQSAIGVERRQATVATRDELMELVDELARGAAAQDYPHTVTVRHETTGNVLSLVVGADLSLVQFYRGDDPDQNPWESEGAGERGALLTFFFDGHHGEIPAEECIPIELALAALEAFRRTGERPANLAWTRAW